MAYLIAYHIALSLQQGRMAFTLQTMPSVVATKGNSTVAQGARISLQAEVASDAHERAKSGRLRRNFTRPAVPPERISLAGEGNVNC